MKRFKKILSFLISGTIFLNSAQLSFNASNLDVVQQESIAKRAENSVKKQKPTEFIKENNDAVAGSNLLKFGLGAFCFLGIPLLSRIIYRIYKHSTYTLDNTLKKIEECENPEFPFINFSAENWHEQKIDLDTALEFKNSTLALYKFCNKRISEKNQSQLSDEERTQLIEIFERSRLRDDSEAQNTSEIGFVYDKPSSEKILDFVGYLLRTLIDSRNLEPSEDAKILHIMQLYLESHLISKIKRGTCHDFSAYFFVECAKLGIKTYFLALPNHIVNIYKYNDKWYVVDVTNNRHEILNNFFAYWVVYSNAESNVNIDELRKELYELRKNAKVSELYLFNSQPLDKFLETH